MTESILSEIEIYSTQLCAYCWRAKDLLDSRGIPYTEIDATAPGEREAMIGRAGGARTVPQIFIGGRHVGGADELAALARTGGLDELMQPG